MGTKILNGTEIRYSCAVKPCAQKCILTVMITRCKIYFVFSIFVVYTNHENIFPMKISRSMVLCCSSTEIIRKCGIIMNNAQLTFSLSRGVGRGVFITGTLLDVLVP